MQSRDSCHAGVLIVCEPGGDQEGKELAADIQRNVGIPVDLQAERPGAPLGTATIVITVLTSVLTNVATELVMDALKRWLASRRGERGDLHVQLEIRRTKRSKGRRFLLKIGNGQHAETALKLESAGRYIVEISTPRAPNAGGKH